MHTACVFPQSLLGTMYNPFASFTLCLCGIFFTYVHILILLCFWINHSLSFCFGKMHLFFSVSNKSEHSFTKPLLPTYPHHPFPIEKIVCPYPQHIFSHAVWVSIQNRSLQSLMNLTNCVNVYLIVVFINSATHK